VSEVIPVALRRLVFERAGGRCDIEITAGARQGIANHQRREGAL